MRFTIKDALWLTALLGLVCLYVRQQQEIGHYRNHSGELFSAAMRYASRRCDYLDECQEAASRDAELAVLDGKINTLQAQINQLKDHPK